MSRATTATLALLLALTAGRAATLQEIVDGNRHTLDGIRDFTTIMTFSVRSPNARVPDSRVKIYFKAPDKLKPEAMDNSFTVLPRTYNMAIGNVLERMLADNAARLMKEEPVDGRPQYLLKLTPKDEQAPPDLYHLVWVDREQYTVTRIRIFVPGERPATMNLAYRRQGKGYLPVSCSIEGYERKPDGGGFDRVLVAIRFSGYKVNVGLSDEIFKDQPPD